MPTMTTVTRRAQPQAGGCPWPPLVDAKHETLGMERAIICVWKSTTGDDSDLLRNLLAAASSPTEEPFGGTACVVDKWADETKTDVKTTVLLTGTNAMRAALRLTSLKSNSTFYPWSNITEHKRDWICPRISCLECRPNIGAAVNCRNCGGPKPIDHLQSLRVWREQTKDVAGAKASEDRCGADGHREAAINKRQPAPGSVGTCPPDQTTGPAIKRTRVDAVASYHPSADEEKSRLTVWGCEPGQLSSGKLVGAIQTLVASRANFDGSVSVVDQFRADRAVIVLAGRHAHRAALLLTNLPNGPNAQRPWKNFSEHHREWYCPQLSCSGLGIDRPNIDDSNGKNRATALCRGCNGPRPRNLLQHAQIWEEEITKSIEEDRAWERELERALANDDVGGGRGLDGALARRAPNTKTVAAATPRAGPCEAARPVAASHANGPTTSATSTSSSRAEFAAWSRAQATAGMLNPFGAPLSSSRLFLNHTKTDLLCLLPSRPSRRIWAFDTNPKNGAKGWIWTDCVETFVNVYLQLDPTRRHAYEVVQSNIPCRVVFDLDMFTGDGENAGKNDEQMAKAIGEFQRGDNTTPSSYACHMCRFLTSLLLLPHTPQPPTLLLEKPLPTPHLISGGNPSRHRS